MRREMLRKSSSQSIGEVALDEKIERELVLAEKLETKWLERTVGEGVKFAWVWVA
jgi:hypothetical protein